MIQQPSTFALLLIRAVINLVRANQKERECGGEVAMPDGGRVTALAS